MNTIITIGRQYGSGGREIGQKIADHYGIKFYDRELLARVAKESGFCKEIIQREDEPSHELLFYTTLLWIHTPSAAELQLPLPICRLARRFFSLSLRPSSPWPMKVRVFLSDAARMRHCLTAKMF